MNCQEAATLSVILGFILAFAGAVVGAAREGGQKRLKEVLMLASPGGILIFLGIALRFLC